jgi:hypothetical protein
LLVKNQATAKIEANYPQWLRSDTDKGGNSLAENGLLVLFPSIFFTQK